MEKVIKNGEVAIVLTYSFGVGWSTWNPDHAETLLFHPSIIKAVEDGEIITESWLKDNLGLKDICVLGADKLCVVWLPVGTKFTVIEYDGSEYIITLDDLVYTA
jgi:hypothetical protein